jgi:hypothetical protein
MASPENELLQDADAQEEEMPADDDGHGQAQSPEPQDETDHQPDDDPQDQAVQQPADDDLFDGPITAVFPDVAEIEDDDDDDEVMEEEEVGQKLTLILLYIHKLFRTHLTMKLLSDCLKGSQLSANVRLKLNRAWLAPKVGIGRHKNMLKQEPVIHFKEQIL